MRQSFGGAFSLGLVALAIVSPLGCDSVGPSRGELVGRWGGSSAQLVATDSGATLRQVCSVVSIREPLRVDSEGRFSVAGLRSREGGAPPAFPEPPPQAVVVSGEELLRDDTFLRVSVRSEGGEPIGESLLLRRGTFVDIPGCP